MYILYIGYLSLQSICSSISSHIILPACLCMCVCERVSVCVCLCVCQKILQFLVLFSSSSLIFCNHSRKKLSEHIVIIRPTTQPPNHPHRQLTHPPGHVCVHVFVIVAPQLRPSWGNSVIKDS